MNREQIIAQIRAKRSYLCVGIDPDIQKLPPHLLKGDNPILDFNKAIIDATAQYAIAFKLNLAFYETLGAFGMQVFGDTVDYIRQNYPEQLIIADAKRGDIGNTSKMYARAFYENFKVDALTVAPYMGSDSVLPFLEYSDKWVILLALTSNQGAQDFQMLHTGEETCLFEQVLKTALSWEGADHIMFVVGATQSNLMERVRAVAPNAFLLVPGVGAQGGSLEAVAEHAMTSDCGLIVNSSRGIIYAGNDERFASAAAQAASDLARQMEQTLIDKGIID